MTFEHFKTCVLAYFPDHDFYWLRYCRRHFHMPICMSKSFVRNVFVCIGEFSPVEPIPNDEKTLIRYLKQAIEAPSINPDTLAFGGDLYQVNATEDSTAIDLVLNEISISTYPKNIWTNA